MKQSTSENSHSMERLFRDTERNEKVFNDLSLKQRRRVICRLYKGIEQERERMINDLQ